jgi:Luciferase-like monooxygenase
MRARAAAEQIQDAYLGHAKEQAAALVPAELVAGMSLIGTEGFVRDRMAAYRDVGVTILNVQPVGPNAMHGGFVRGGLAGFGARREPGHPAP